MYPFLDVDTKAICRAMRSAVRDQVTDFVNKEAFHYAEQHKLVRVGFWPAFSIQITDKGKIFLREYEGSS